MCPSNRVKSNPTVRDYSKTSSAVVCPPPFTHGMKPESSVRVSVGVAVQITLKPVSVTLDATAFATPLLFVRCVCVPVCDVPAASL